MKQILISAVVALLVAGGMSLALRPSPATDGVPGAAPTLAADTSASAAGAAGAAGTESTGLSLRYTDSLIEDVWINAAGQAGADHRQLSAASNSVCFITKIEISGISSPDDTNSCQLSVDDFTGFWDLTATVEEGGHSSVRCNARCLIWE